MLAQGTPCWRNAIYVPFFEREEFLSCVISDLKDKPFLPTGTGKRTRLPRSFIKGMHYFPVVVAYRFFPDKMYVYSYAYG